MRWQGRRGSDNIEDRRRISTGGMVGGGGIGLLVVALLVWALGGDPISVLQQGGGGTISQGGEVEITEADQQAAEFVSVTLADTEVVWSNIFQSQLNRQYTPVTLVLFKQVTQSPCGNASGATGPFYCPLDKKVYLDTDFFVTLQRQMGASGDFAAAYVVAHEVAHHVQDELGILSQVNDIRQRSSQEDSNALSVRVELQADCLSGLWARTAAEGLGTIEEGDVAEAMNAASKIGDDTLQRNAGRRPMPDSFTHGSSEQRQRWFATGFKSGQIDACDTFNTNAL